VITIFLLVFAKMLWNNYYSAEGTYVYTNKAGCQDTLILDDNGYYRRVIRDKRLNSFYYSEGKWWYSNRHLWITDWEEGCFNIHHFEKGVTWGFAVGRDFFWRIDKIKITALFIVLVFTCHYWSPDRIPKHEHNEIT
jgi:hypothetical protein